MRRLFLLCISILCIGVAAANESESKIVMKAVKSSMNFTAIEVNNPISVIIEQRTEGNIIIRATEKMMPHIQISVSGNKLTISSDIKQFNMQNASPIAEVYIPYNGKLNSFESTAVSSIDVQPFISVNTLDIECVGASRISLKAKAVKAEVEVAGAAGVKAEIECTTMDATVAGAATLTLSGSATTAEIEVAGASTLKAENFTCSQLDASVVGASKAIVSGNKADIEAVGASSVSVECSTELTATAVGASSIRYTGECQVNILDNIGASSIKKR